VLYDKYVPSRNIVKEYEAGGCYHIYNRGVEKRVIFLDEMDYSVYISYLSTYLSPPIDPESDLQGSALKVLQENRSPSRIPKNYFGEIKLLAYCLMPNHFHLMVTQESEHGIDQFMRSVSTKYVRYFNTKYKRVGPLFQSTYKAVRVESEYQYVYLSKYIHRNPLDLFAKRTYIADPCRLDEYKYSSYGNYLHKYKQNWVMVDEILGLFGDVNKRISYKNYREFVEESSEIDLDFIKEAVLDIMD
jgi:putative transposase